MLTYVLWVEKSMKNVSTGMYLQGYCLAHKRIFLINNNTEKKKKENKLIVLNQIYAQS